MLNSCSGRRTHCRLMDGTFSKLEAIQIGSFALDLVRVEFERWTPRNEQRTVNVAAGSHSLIALSITRERVGARGEPGVQISIISALSAAHCVLSLILPSPSPDLPNLRAHPLTHIAISPNSGARNQAYTSFNSLSVYNLLFIAS